MREHLAGVFQYEGVADAYEDRPPYPDEVFDILVGLIADRPRTVLDIGAGEGALARPLAALVDRVDAVDLSAAMVAAGQDRPGGRRPNLRWSVSPAETAPLDGPYALVTAGASLHWMRRRALIDRIAPAMTEPAVLAVVEHGPRDLPWRSELVEVIVRHSRSPDYNPNASPVDDLIADGLVDLVGRAETAPVAFAQPLDAYVRQFHSTASLAREHMSADEAAAFDQAVTAIVRPYATDGQVELAIVARLAWVRPRRGQL